MVTPTELLTAALRYAELGYRVFPCVPGGKNPITRRGFHDATTDPGCIERWWARYPLANIGIATAGLIVIDIEGANNSWPGDPDRICDLAGTPLSLTPRGGTHRVFRQPVGKKWRCTKGSLAPKVDTRANGGYVIAPPSVVEGKSYHWAPGLELDDPPEQLPEPPAWLVAELDKLVFVSPRKVHTATSDTGGHVIPTGHRNGTLVRLGGTMRRVGMTRAEMAAALLQVNQDRCRPPLSPREVARIAASVAHYEPDQIAVAVAEDHWGQMYTRRQPAEEVADPGPISEHLLRVPGFIDEVMSYTLRTAPYPDRTLAFGAALALQSLLAGSKVRDPSGINTDLFVLTLANPGAGQAYPQQVNQKLLAKAGLTDSLGVFGSAIPKDFWDALSPSLLTNGFFDQILTVEAGPRGRGQDVTVHPLPDSILRVARWWAEFAPAAGHPVPRVIEHAPKAAEVMAAFRGWADDEHSQAEELDDTVGMAIWAAANEKARRLALIYAASANYRNPVIEADAARWACEFVDHQTRRLLFLARWMVSEDEFDKQCKQLIATLRHWQEVHGDAWMPFWLINRRHPWTERDHAEVRTTLLNQQLIECSDTADGRPAGSYRLLGRV